jgi:hypothetical protein
MSGRDNVRLKYEIRPGRDWRIKYGPAIVIRYYDDIGCGGLDADNTVFIR